MLISQPNSLLPQPRLNTHRGSYTWTAPPNERSCGAGVVLEGPDEIFIEQALKFDFKTSNNQAEYEAILAGLRLAQELEITKLICKSDSRLVIGQLNDEYEVRESFLQRYYHLVKQSISTFSEISMQHVRRLVPVSNHEV